MKQLPSDFAILGGPRAFVEDVPVGQLYFPAWEDYENAIRAIIDRRYYTNHGPNVRELESRLEGYLQVRNAITVTNATLGLYLVCLALELKGKVLMPSFSFVATAQAVALAGLEPVFCDVDPETHQVTPSTAELALEQGVSAVCPVNLWGGTVDMGALELWSHDRNLQLYFDSAHGFGVERSEGMLGRFGRAEVFSFHATKILSAAEGGCVATNDDDLAERIRNMRSNYGIRRPIEVPLTVNARMSEGQAAIALCSLDDIDRRLERNMMTFKEYRAVLRGLPGLRLVTPTHVSRSNYQYVVVQVESAEFGLTRDALWSLLRAEGVRVRRYFKPGIHRSAPFDTLYPRYLDALPVTDDLCGTVLQLPVGALVSITDAARIGELIGDAHRHAGALQRHV